MAKGDTRVDEVSDLEEELSAEQSRARVRLQKLIQQRGIRPITIDQLRAMGDLWPKNENVDEFTAAIREWRRDGSTRRLT